MKGQQTKKAKELSNAKNKSDEHIAKECFDEVIAVLKKHDCGMRINYELKAVMDSEGVFGKIVIYKNAAKK